MARYKMSDEMVVDTDRSSTSVFLDKRKLGYGYLKETLYRSRRGRWYIEYLYSWEEDDVTLDHAEWLSNEEACRKLAVSGLSAEDMAAWPELQKLYDQVVE